MAGANLETLTSNSPKLSVKRFADSTLSGRFLKLSRKLSAKLWLMQQSDLLNGVLEREYSLASLMAAGEQFTR